MERDEEPSDAIVWMGVAESLAQQVFEDLGAIVHALKEMPPGVRAHVDAAHDNDVDGVLTALFLAEDREAVARVAAELPPILLIALFLRFARCRQLAGLPHPQPLRIPGIRGPDGWRTALAWMQSDGPLPQTPQDPDPTHH